MTNRLVDNTIRIAALLSVVLLGSCAVSPTVSTEAARAELAPTGKVRLAVTGNNPNYLNLPTREPYSGVAVDIGNAVVKGLGVPLQIVVYPSTSALLADAGSGKWDAILVGIEDSRRAFLDYSSAYATTPNSYLVPAGSGLMTIADVDRAAVRVLVSQGTIQHTHLKSTLRQASLATTINVTEAAKELTAGRADALAANRPTVESLAARMPGYRVLPGSFYEVRYGVAVPKGRPAAAAYVDQVVREMRASGAMADVLKRANLTALSVPSD